MLWHAWFDSPGCRRDIGFITFVPECEIKMAADLLRQGARLGCVMTAVQQGRPVPLCSVSSAAPIVSGRDQDALHLPADGVHLLLRTNIWD